MPNPFNENIIKEFRDNEGRVGGPFQGAPMALLTSKGAKSGQSHTTPLVYMQDGDRIVVFASKGGAPSNPAWYYNLKTNPDATVEVGTDKYEVRAEILEGEERDRIFNQQASIMPQFAEYQQRTTRTIPVIALERV